jgi:hypothetical protein
MEIKCELTFAFHLQVPYFINELTVTDIELGTEVPFINRASKPYLDDRGLWVDLDILYQGGFHMILETKCNLMKLKKNADVNTEEKTTPVSATRHVPLTYNHRSMQLLFSLWMQGVD